MRHSSEIRPTSVGNCPTDVGSRVAAKLRQIHPAKTAQSVAADTGVPVSTVEKLLERQTAPSAMTLFALMRAYGASFMAAVVPEPPRWLSEAAYAERIARAEAAVSAARAALESAKGGDW